MSCRQLHSSSGRVAHNENKRGEYTKNQRKKCGVVAKRNTRSKWLAQFLACHCYRDPSQKKIKPFFFFHRNLQRQRRRIYTCTHAHAHTHTHAHTETHTNTHTETHTHEISLRTSFRFFFFSSSPIFSLCTYTYFIRH